MKLVSPNFSDLLTPNIEIRQFPDGESYVRIPGLSAFKDNEVTLFHRLYPEQDRSLLQAMLMLRTLKDSGVKTTLVSPYLPYARQDKIFLEGEAKSAVIVCSLLAAAGAARLITLDCHFMKKEGETKYGGLAIKNLSMSKTLIAHASKIFKEEFLVISPDVGAKYMTTGFEGGHMEKVRGRYVEGMETEREIVRLESSLDLKGKNVLIIDDMISTGGTMIRAVENVKKGGAKKIVCTATHGLFLKDSLSKLKKASDYLFVSNSIQSPVAEVDIMKTLRSAL